MGLPALETYVHLYSASELQLLKTPLVNIYVDLISFGLRAVKLVDRSVSGKSLFYLPNEDRNVLMSSYNWAVHLELVAKRFQIIDHEHRRQPEERRNNGPRGTYERDSSDEEG